MKNQAYTRPIYIGKNQNPKNLGFLLYRLHCQKNHNILGFWHEKRMREKTRFSYLCFGKWCACATSLYLWQYTCSAHYVAGRGRVIPLKVTYHVTKNPNNTGEIGASVYIGKNQWNFGGVSKNHAAEVGFSIQVFWVFRGSCLATFNEKPECEKDSFFFMPV